MGGAINRGTRFLRMYNIDNRVNKVLSKEKPTPAPRHTADQQNIQASNAESKNFICFFRRQMIFIQIILHLKLYIIRMNNY